MPRLSFAAFSDDDTVTRDQAADLLGCSAAALSDWACQGRGPKFVRLGIGKRSPVAYQIRALKAWLAEQTRASTTAA